MLIITPSWLICCYAVAACRNLERFGKVTKLTAFKPFTSAADALEQINAVSESQLTDELKNFLEVSLPKVRGTDTAGTSFARRTWPVPVPRSVHRTHQLNASGEKLDRVQHQHTS